MNKFTATMVTEDVKNAVIALRKELDLSEKDLMTILLNTALDNKDAIVERANNLNTAYAFDRVAKRAAAYNALKEKIKSARAEAREARKAARAQIAETAAKVLASKSKKSKKVKAVAAPAAEVVAEPIVETVTA